MSERWFGKMQTFGPSSLKVPTQKMPLPSSSSFAALFWPRKGSLESCTCCCGTPSPDNSSRSGAICLWGGTVSTPAEPGAKASVYASESFQLCVSIVSLASKKKRRKSKQTFGYSPPLGKCHPPPPRLTCHPPPRSAR